MANRYFGCRHYPVVKCILIKRTLKLIAFVPLMLGQLAWGQSFIISDIRVEGLQRISAGSVFASMPLAVGDAVDDQQTRASFLALLSISLGVLNLLPIPVLDGGHLMYYTLELLFGRPVPEKIQMMGYQLGLFMVLSIMVLALYNDFSRL